MRIKQSTIDSNVRMSRFKVAVYEVTDLDEFKDLTHEEFNLVLHEILTDGAKYRLRKVRGKDTED